MVAVVTLQVGSTGSFQRSGDDHVAALAGPVEWSRC